MPEKTPVRVDYTNNTATGLAEYQTSEYISVKHGGTGNSSVSASELLIGNTVPSDPKYIKKKILGELLISKIIVDGYMSLNSKK